MQLDGGVVPMVFKSRIKYSKEKKRVAIQTWKTQYHSIMRLAAQVEQTDQAQEKKNT